MFAYQIPDPRLALDLSQEILKIAIGADSTLLGIVLTGLAIATSMAHREFVQWLISNRLYASLTKPFVVACVLWASHLVLSVLTLFGSYIFHVPKLVFLAIVFLHGSVFGFALAVTVGLVVLILELGKRQAEFDEIFTHRRNRR